MPFASSSNLAAFYAASRSSRDPVYATYMLTGEAAPPNRQTLRPSQDEMDVDMDGPGAEEEGEGDEPDSEPVPLTRIVLVGENDLESTLCPTAGWLHVLRSIMQMQKRSSSASSRRSSTACPQHTSSYASAHGYRSAAHHSCSLL